MLIFFSSRIRHTRCALVTGVQTCALPIFSRSATQERLAKLQASGAITGFTLAEGSAVGGRESAWLMVRFEPGKRCADVVPKLKRIPTIAALHSVSGAIDLILRVDGEDVAAIEASRSAVAAVPGVRSEEHTS